MKVYRIYVKLLVSAIVALLLNGCTIGYDNQVYAVQNDRQLLTRIAAEIISPADRVLFQSESEELDRIGVDWQDVARFQTNCQIRKIGSLASRQDLEVIHFIWSQGGSSLDRAVNEVKQSLGNAAYSQASEIFAGASFDCLFETNDHIETLKGR